MDPTTNPAPVPPAPAGDDGGVVQPQPTAAPQEPTVSPAPEPPAPMPPAEPSAPAEGGDNPVPPTEPAA